MGCWKDGTKCASGRRAVAAHKRTCKTRESVTGLSARATIRDVRHTTSGLVGQVVDGSSGVQKRAVSGPTKVNANRSFHRFQCLGKFHVWKLAHLFTVRPGSWHGTNNLVKLFSSVESEICISFGALSSLTIDLGVMTVIMEGFWRSLLMY